MKTLVVYFSRGGHTAKLAEKIKGIVGADDILEIKGDKIYGGYFKALRIASKEYKAEELPTVTTKAGDLSSYERIILGFPIWYGKCPRLVVSFMKQQGFEGKDIYPFCTSGASAMGDAAGVLSTVCEGAKIHEGQRFSKKTDEAAINEWLSK
ncbi:MAG: flavodoxin [Clostridia bacterium]|nr:flavodoxin [Clostridia bacterium]